MQTIKTNCYCFIHTFPLNNNNYYNTAYPLVWKPLVNFIRYDVFRLLVGIAYIKINCYRIEF